MTNSPTLRVDNLEVIQGYLGRAFPDCILSEVPALSASYTFIVESVELKKSYKLKVHGALLLDRTPTPNQLLSRLEGEDAAGRMKQADGAAVLFGF